MMELRVFLVEDLSTMRGLLQDVFATVGGLSVVATAATEAEAILWLEDHAREWDLALVDLVLEQGSGLGVLRHASRLARPGAQVVVFSSYATPAVRAHCLDLGAHHVFDKAQTSDFIAWLARYVGRDDAR